MKNSNLYNDKELFEDADLNWYDYGFRNYDPQIGRFPQLDPLTDGYPELTPYQYASNEPIANIDIDGLEAGTATNAFNQLQTLQGVFVAGIKKAPAELAKTASHIVPLGMAAINIASNVVSSQIETKTLNNGLSNTNIKNQLAQGVLDYYQANKGTMSITDLFALNTLTNNYFKGLNCMAWWAKGDFLKLNRAVIKSTISDPLKINIVQLGIQDSQEGWHSIFRSGADVGIFISGAGLFPQTGMGPKGSMLKFRTPPVTKGGNGALEGAVQSNYKRFVSKIPANSKSNASYQLLDDGNYLFQASSPGNVQGSRALYQKWVNPQGETFKMLKTTFAPNGSIVHIKPKL